MSLLEFAEQLVADAEKLHDDAVALRRSTQKYNEQLIREIENV
jgi:hypothetical protein